jgi:hypothetical protein
MASYERLLVPGSTDLPDCHCGELMHIEGGEELSNRTDAQIRIYRCPVCHHEMRLTVWSDDLLG